MDYRAYPTCRRWIYLRLTILFEMEDLFLSYMVYRFIIAHYTNRQTETLGKVWRYRYYRPERSVAEGEIRTGGPTCLIHELAGAVPPIWISSFKL